VASKWRARRIIQAADVEGMRAHHQLLARGLDRRRLVQQVAVRQRHQVVLRFHAHQGYA
jgi:hypothetical protein